EHLIDDPAALLVHRLPHGLARLRGLGEQVPVRADALMRGHRGPIERGRILASPAMPHGDGALAATVHVRPELPLMLARVPVAGQFELGVSHQSSVWSAMPIDTASDPLPTFS